MDRFFNKKHKKTPGPHNPVYPGIPTNTAAGSSGLQEVQGIGPSGERNHDYFNIEIERLIDPIRPQ